MKGTRILRYIGNRPNPERDPYSLDDYLRQSPFLLLGEKESELLRRLDGKVPDPVLSDFYRDGPGTLWHKTDSNAFNQLFGVDFAMSIPLQRVTSEAPKITQDEFEVNLVEPLMGWRAWWLDDEGMLRSLNDTDFVWPREKRAEAGCERFAHRAPPVEKCTCGIYAVNTRQNLAEDFPTYQEGMVTGIVYGWGRYVRGEKGFRCQYAYPRCFYLNGMTSIVHAVHGLRQYRVPIYFDQPVKLYTPQEDGYDGYWTNEADRNLGAYEESDTAEEAGSDEIPF
jgi:hypothetical protein